MASDTPPRIGYLLGRYPTASETFVYREIAGLLTEGADVLCWSLEPDSGPEHGILDDHLVRAVPRARWCLRRAAVAPALESSWQRVEGSAKDLRRAAWLARKFADENIDVICAHFLGRAAGVACATSQLSGIPLVVTVHARGIHVPTPMGLWTLGAAAQAVAISEDGARACHAREGVSALVLPLAAEPHDTLEPGSSTALRVLTVARPAPKKGYEVLREALDGLQTPWQWTVAGATADEVGGAMPGLIALGVIGAPDVDAAFRRGVDAFVLPCRVAEDGDRDGVPVALMEAMARGVPVVTTAVGGIGELVEDGRTGLLVPPDDAVSLRQALHRLATDSGLRRRMGRAGRDHVRTTRQPRVRSRRLLECLAATASTARR